MAARMIKSKCRIVAALALFLILPLSAGAQRLLVFPFEQKQGPESAKWLGMGLGVAVHDALSVSGVPSMPLEDLLYFYDQEGLVPQPSFSLAAQLALARQLGAGAVVTGNYDVAGEAVTAEVQLISLDGDPELKGRWKESSSLRDLLDLTARLRDHLLPVMGKSPANEAPVKPEAFEAYIRGRIADDATVKEVYFRKAVEIEPAYDDAWCYLAKLLFESGRVTEAKSILEKLRPKNYAKAYIGLCTLGQIRLEGGAFGDARSLFELSIKRGENAQAHIGLARLLMRQKRFSEASREIKVARSFGTDQDDIDQVASELDRLKAAPQPAPSAGGSPQQPPAPQP